MISETKSNKKDAEHCDPLKWDQAAAGVSVGTDDDDSLHYTIFSKTNSFLGSLSNNVLGFSFLNLLYLSVSQASRTSLEPQKRDLASRSKKQFSMNFGIVPGEAENINT